MLQDDKQKKIDEAAEVLDTIGQENEKEGIKWTQYFMNIWDQHELDRKLKKKDRLKKATIYKKMEYHRIIAGMIQEEAKQLDIPDRFMVWSEFTQDGVIVRLVSPSGDKFNRAFRPTGEPGIDLNAVFGILVDVQTTIDDLEEKRFSKLRESGLIIP